VQKLTQGYVAIFWSRARRQFRQRHRKRSIKRESMLLGESHN
jgi:hypothetical protein